MMEKMDTKTQEKSGITTRKTTQYVKFCAKEERNASLKKVSTILQKAENERSVEEQQMLCEYSEIVADLKLRWHKRDEAKRRVEEVEEPVDILEEKCRILAQALMESEHLVIYTGAGISTAARIPDYRGTNGIWTRLQQGKEIGNHDLSQAEPTFTHMALSQLYHQNKLKYVVSQNCDGLHLRSGLPRSALSELHGNMYVEVCKKCQPVREYWRLFDVTENTARFSHKTMRRCYSCNSELLDTIVHFGERGTLQWPLNWSGACKNADKADTILCLGSSLKVLKRYPWLWQMNKPAKKRPNLYIVNLQWTPKDDCAMLKIHGKCDDVMKRVMKLLNIEVPGYNRENDPIFAHATPLSELELHTTTQPFLKTIEWEVLQLTVKQETIDSGDDKQKSVHIEIKDEEAHHLATNVDSQEDHHLATKVDNQEAHHLATNVDNKQITIENSNKKIPFESKEDKENSFHSENKEENLPLKNHEIERTEVNSIKNEEIVPEMKEVGDNCIQKIHKNEENCAEECIKKEINENLNNIKSDLNLGTSKNCTNISEIDNSINFFQEQNEAYDLTVKRETSQNCDKINTHSNLKSAKLSANGFINCTSNEVNNFPKRKSLNLEKNPSVFSIDSILNKQANVPKQNTNVDNTNLQTIMAYYEFTNSLIQNQMLSYLTSGVYPFQTGFLYPGLHSILNPIPFINYDFNCSNNQINKQTIMQASIIEHRSKPACVFCHKTFESFICLYYKKTEPVFKEQLFRFSKIKNCNQELACLCCDYTTEEDSEDEIEKKKKVKREIECENDDDSNLDEDQKKIDKIEIKKVQAGWFGKGCRKNRKHRKKQCSN